MEEEKNVPRSDMDSVRFVSLVAMFATSAYQSMGKIANPLTGKVERNLEAAQGFIDILLMLRGKMKGNLTSEEERMLAGTISELQLNFVKEKEKPEEPKAKDEGQETKGAEAGTKDEKPQTKGEGWETKEKKSKQ